MDSTLTIPYKNLKTWWLCGCSTFAIPTQLYIIIGFASTYLKKLRVEEMDLMLVVGSSNHVLDHNKEAPLTCEVEQTFG